MQTAQTSTFHAELLDLNAMDGCAASIPAKTLDALHAGITVPNLSGTLNKKHIDESYPRHEPNAEGKDEPSIWSFGGADGSENIGRRYPPVVRRIHDRMPALLRHSIS